MSHRDYDEEDCPYCGEPVSPTARRCRNCGEYLDDDDYDDDRRGGDATDFVVPTNVSVWSLLAGYAGLFGCLFPGLGLLGVVFGLMGLKQAKRKPRKGGYGSATSDVRAWVGVVLGTIWTLLWLGVGVALIVKN